MVKTLVWVVTDSDAETRQHAEDPLGRDATLCGLSLDGDDVVGNILQYKKIGRVDCEQCRTIITFCRRYL